MSESMRMVFEIGFNVFYLVVIWTLVALMSRRMGSVCAENRAQANLFRWAFFLLALGDTGHVGFRVAAYLLGGLEQNSLLVGLGALATAVTVTIFYVLMLYIWKARFNGKFGWFEYFLLASAAARLVVIAFPQNEWGSLVPPAFWGVFRNIFLMVLGVGVLYLILRDALKTNDSTYKWVGICIFFSYLFYMPVIFWVREVPMLGMLMIPKTIMYLAIAFLAYYGLWPQSKSPQIASPAV